ncbi:7198_t:CDS:2, partial [Gigaspora margarita]
MYYHISEFSDKDKQFEGIDTYISLLFDAFVLQVVIIYYIRLKFNKENNNSDNNNTNTDNYKPPINYKSDNNYKSNNNESIYKELAIEIPVANLTEPNSYSPFDNYKVIATQLSKLVSDNMNSNYNNNLLINLITESLKVEKIKYFALPIECLPTLEQGIAIIFN